MLVLPYVTWLRIIVQALVNVCSSLLGPLFPEPVKFEFTYLFDVAGPFDVELSYPY